jgi:hypothetical protein
MWSDGNGGVPPGERLRVGEIVVVQQNKQAPGAVPRDPFLWAVVVLVVVAIAWVIVLIVHGLAFTPLWSGVFAAWFLILLTLALHLLVVNQGDPEIQAALDSAQKASLRARQVADRAEQVVRDANPPTAAPALAQAAQAGRQVTAAAEAESTATVRSRRAGLKSLVVGADGRASTSKVGAAAWTYAILFALAFMLVLGRKLNLDSQAQKDFANLKNGFDAFINAGFQPEYLALLGFPIGAAVTAKALTTNKVIQGTLDKSAGQSTGVPAGLAELVSNDSGQTDLLDFQYIAFNVFTLIYFLVSLATITASHPGSGLPQIPATLLALSGVSATGYLFKKATETGVAPTVTAVAPLSIVLGVDRTLQIVGDGFLSPGATVSPANQVLLDGKVLPVQPGDWQQTAVTAQLPTGDRNELTRLGWRDRSADTPADLIVRDESGNSSPAVKMMIALPAAPPAAPAVPGAPAAPAPRAAP